MSALGLISLQVRNWGAIWNMKIPNLHLILLLIYNMRRKNLNEDCMKLNVLMIL